MAEVKWIKIVTDVFDDEKVLLIETLPDADSIIVIWFKLLCLAGKQNNGGVFLMGGRIPYTEEMFATIFRRPLNTVRLALRTFQEYGMVDIIDNTVTIPHWEKHQSLDAYEQSKEKTRQRVAKHREKQRLLIASSTCQYCGGEATGYDHIIPLARGGSDTEDNKVPCCIECNRKKNDKPLVDFLNYSRERINDSLVLSNDKISRYVTLCNVTDRYIVTDCNAIDKIRREEIREDKKREEKKETTHDLFIRLEPDYIIPDNLKLKLCDWFAYKTERKEAYKEQGMKSLLRQIENNQLMYGEKAVCDLIDDSMANGWKGIIFDRLKKMPVLSYAQRTNTNPFLDLAGDCYE